MRGSPRGAATAFTVSKGVHREGESNEEWSAHPWKGRRVEIHPPPGCQKRPLRHLAGSTGTKCGNA
jgi:hypothetical protein